MSNYNYIKPKVEILRQYKVKNNTYVEFRQGYIGFTVKYSKELWPSVKKMIEEFKQKGKEV